MAHETQNDSRDIPAVADRRGPDFLGLDQMARGQGWAIIAVGLALLWGCFGLRMRSYLDAPDRLFG